MELALRLKESIQGNHTAIENLAFSRAMIGGTVDRDSYTMLLSQLRHIHEALEADLASHGELAGVYKPSMDRTAVLDRDLAALNAIPPELPIEITSLTIGAIARWNSNAIWSLIGCLYVFEGSRMGSMALARPIAKALGLAAEPGQGIDYHLDGIRERGRNWQQFRADLHAAGLTPAEEADVMTGADVTMQMLCGLYAEISARMSEPLVSSR